MDRSITDLFHQLPDRGLPARHSTEYVPYAQGDAFFRLAAHKNSRVRALRRHVAQHGIRRIFLSACLGGFGFEHPGCEVHVLERGFFQDASEHSRAAKRELIDGAVVLVNNNDVGWNSGESHYAEFFSTCTRTIFVAWDWDNHHWLDLSPFLAAHSDLYCPSHHENLYLLSRFNWLTTGPLYCASVQWPREFLAARLPGLIAAPRSDEPLGKHIPYSPFSFRNRVVSTLGSRYASIGFSDRSFHARTPEERLLEWQAHKLHWIVPVLNDVPIRIFDALITGGIPIVPESLRHLPPVSAIDRRHIVFYTPDDVIDPGPLVARALALFDQGGADGLVARHRHALDHHHGDSRVRQVLASLAEQFEARIGAAAGGEP